MTHGQEPGLEQLQQGSGDGRQTSQEEQAETCVSRAMGFGWVPAEQWYIAPSSWRR